MIRGIIQSVVEGVIKRFSAAGRTDETITNREYFQHYGFTSRPLAGSEAILIQEDNHIVMIASDDRRYRLGIEAGEVCLYTDEGDHIRMMRNKEIYVKSGNKLTVEAATQVDITAPTVIIMASTKVRFITPLLEATGNVADSVRSMAGDRAIYNIHTHDDPQGGTVDVPNQQE